MPAGFKLNIQETIIKKKYIKKDGTEDYYYIWADADGTEHYFLSKNGSTTEYEDEDGLQLTLNIYSATCTITDNSKTVKTFAKDSVMGGDIYGSWYLTKIADKNNNVISFAFDSSKRPITVSLTPNGSTKIDYLTIAYNSDHLPYVIWL